MKDPRFFYTPQYQNTWPKLFVLTDDGILFSQYLVKMVLTNQWLLVDYKTFKSENYNWGGYQPVVEISQEKALRAELVEQENWVSRYLREVEMDEMSDSIPNLYPGSLVLTMDVNKSKENRFIKDIVFLESGGRSFQATIRQMMKIQTDFREKPMVSNSEEKELYPYMLPVAFSIKDSTDRKDDFGNTIYPLRAYKRRDDFIARKIGLQDLFAGGLLETHPFEPLKDYIACHLKF